MKLGDLKTLSRLYVPGAKTNVITDDNLVIILNDAAVNVAYELRVLKKSTNINAVAEQQEYKISDLVTDYLCIDDEGIWYYDGYWKQLEPVTQKYLDEEMTGWRDDASGVPQRYYISGDTIGLHPKPSSSVSNGIKIYYARKPLPMVTNDDFPFHKEGVKTVEIPQYSVLSDCIFAYFEFRTAKILSKDDQERLVLEQTYYQEIERKRKLIDRRPDIHQNRYNRMRGNVKRT